jgi:hypothetical protein
MQHSSGINAQAGNLDAGTWDFSFCIIACTEYDVPWFVKWMDLVSVPKGLVVADGCRGFSDCTHIAMPGVS